MRFLLGIKGGPVCPRASTHKYGYSYPSSFSCFFLFVVMAPSAVILLFSEPGHAVATNTASRTGVRKDGDIPDHACSISTSQPTVHGLVMTVDTFL